MITTTYNPGTRRSISPIKAALNVHVSAHFCMCGSLLGVKQLACFVHIVLLQRA